MSSIEESPSMVEPDAPQLGEVALLISEAKTIVDSGCRKDGSRANGTGGELVVLVDDGTQGSGVKGGHGRATNRRGRGRGIQVLEDWANICSRCMHSSGA